MKVLVLMHTDLLPPEDQKITKKDLEFAPWAAEYDVLQGLKKAGHTVQQLGVKSDLLVIRKAIEEFKPKIVFNILEEFGGEAVFDQNVVSYLELLKMPYTGCNPRGLILARDKALSKKILTYHRIRTPKFQVFPRNKPRTKLRLKKFPLIVKCLNEEASLGISQASVVTNVEKLKERVEFIHKQFFVDAIVEEFIEGSEYYVGLFGNYRLTALPVWRLNFKEVDAPEKELYSTKAKFDVKYRKRKGISTGPANVSKELEAKIHKIAKKAYETLGLNGYARIDLRVDKNERVYVIEANPNPDISSQDDFASSAKKADISYEDLLGKILNLGVQWNPVN